MALNPIIAGLLSIVFVAPAPPAQAKSNWLSTGQMPIESEFLKAHSAPPSPAPSIPDESKQVPEANTPPEPVAPSPSITGPRTALLDCIARYESNGYSDNRNPSYKGRYQFAPSTWRAMGGSGNPAFASPAEQDMRALRLIDQEGLNPWPVPSRRCGHLL